MELVTGAKDDPSGGHSFSMGDNVEVCVGDLENLQAKIIAIDGAMITVMPKHQAEALVRAGAPTTSTRMS